MQNQLGSSSLTAKGSLQAQKDTDQLDELFYQAAWKLGQWDICLPQR